MKSRFSHKTRSKRQLSPMVGGILICLFMTAFTTVAIRQGGLNFGAVAIMAMFWIVGIAMVAQGAMKRLGIYDKTTIKDLPLKVIITAFGACMAAVGLWLGIVMVGQELFVKRNGWSLQLLAVVAFSLPFAIVGTFCFRAGIAGIRLCRRDALSDQRNAKSYLDYPLKRVMSQNVRGTLTFSVIWWTFIVIAALVSYAKTQSAWSMLPLMIFAGVGIHLLTKAFALLRQHRVKCLHRVRLSTPALYPGGKVTVAYEAIRPFAGGKMCAVVSQLDMSIREMRPGESTDIDADKSVKDVVAKQLSCESGRFTFRMPKARYEERIRWELRLQFKPEKGDFVDEHFRLPLS